MNFNSGTCFSIYALKHKLNPHHYKALHCIKTIKIQIIVSTAYFLILSAAKSQRDAPLPPATLIQWLPDLWLERLDQTFAGDSFLVQFLLQTGPCADQAKARLYLRQLQIACVSVAPLVSKDLWNWNTVGLEGMYCKGLSTAWVVGHLDIMKVFLWLMVRCSVSLWSNDQGEKRKIDLEIISSIWECIIYVTSLNAPFFVFCLDLLLKDFLVS